MHFPVEDGHKPFGGPGGEFYGTDRCIFGVYLIRVDLKL